MDNERERPAHVSCRAGFLSLSSQLDTLGVGGLFFVARGGVLQPSEVLLWVFGVGYVLLMIGFGWFVTFHLSRWWEVHRRLRIDVDGNRKVVEGAHMQLEALQTLVLMLQDRLQTLSKETYEVQLIDRDELGRLRELVGRLCKDFQCQRGDLQLLLDRYERDHPAA